MEKELQAHSGELPLHDLMRLQHKAAIQAERVCVVHPDNVLPLNLKCQHRPRPSLAACKHALERAARGQAVKHLLDAVP